MRLNNARRQVLACLLGAVGSLALIGCSDQSEEQAPTITQTKEKPSITMGIFPRRNLATTRKAFRPLTKYLSKQLNANVRLVVPLNFKRFWEGVTKQEFDLVHYNQYHYIVSHKNLGYQVLVTNEEFGRNQIAGALFVRKDSGINTVADLRGKRLLFGGGRKAMGSYIAPLSILKKHGLEPGRDFEEAFSKNPPAAMVNVYHSIFDAAGAGDVVIGLKVIRDKIDTKKMKTLARSESFIQLPWAVKKGMAPEMASHIQQLMTGLEQTEEGRKVLKAAKVTAFRSAADSDFDKVREIVKYTLGEDY
jgi:phosphonate transport system substrate-binding protein